MTRCRITLSATVHNEYRSIHENTERSLYIPKRRRACKNHRHRPPFCVFCKQNFADHRAHRAFSSLSESVEANTKRRRRRDEARPGSFTDGGSLMTCTNEVPIKRKTAGHRASQTAATYRGHDEESARWVQAEMQPRLRSTRLHFTTIAPHNQSLLIRSRCRSCVAMTVRMLRIRFDRVQMRVELSDREAYASLKHR
ncbi:uncharacterized protein LOC113563406 [Ooceraea biroi]|uniref:uncharacterized protein LOC109611497 n=1 Tax=Ooceraea biroi TaxID=2015173 RepID=UPI0009717296|nr:uncharacterized protein LOC109611497 [Ooceraea biroi]XP_026830851.1 uncharacterized protein LOC113563406 [Ooceraea biroi]